MAPAPRTAACRCARSLPLSSAFLLLSAILPSSTLAQVTNSTSHRPTPTPTLTLTSSSTTSTATGKASLSLTLDSLAKITAVKPDATPTYTGVPGAGGGPPGPRLLDYAFVICAGVAIIFIVAFLWLTKNRKDRMERTRGDPKAAALERDVESFRTLFGVEAFIRRGPSQTRRARTTTGPGGAAPDAFPGVKPRDLRHAAQLREEREMASRDSREVPHPHRISILFTPPTLDLPPYLQRAIINANRPGSTEGGDTWIARPAPAATAHPPRKAGA